MNGRKVGNIHQLQLDKKTVSSAKTGDEVACSVQDATIGRQMFEEDVYYTFPPSHEAKQLLNKFMHKLSTEEQEVLNEIVRNSKKEKNQHTHTSFIVNAFLQIILIPGAPTVHISLQYFDYYLR